MKETTSKTNYSSILSYYYTNNGSAQNQNNQLLQVTLQQENKVQEK